jgi:hypothetical protein
MGLGQRLAEADAATVHVDLRLSDPIDAVAMTPPTE